MSSPNTPPPPYGAIQMSARDYTPGLSIAPGGAPGLHHSNHDSSTASINIQFTDVSCSTVADSRPEGHTSTQDSNQHASIESIRDMKSQLSQEQQRVADLQEQLQRLQNRLDQKEQAAMPPPSAPPINEVPGTSSSASRFSNKSAKEAPKRESMSNDGGEERVKSDKFRRPYTQEELQRMEEVKDEQRFQDLEEFPLPAPKNGVITIEDNPGGCANWKDSVACCLVPMFAAFYRTIRIDLDDQKQQMRIQNKPIICGIKCPCGVNYDPWFNPDSCFCNSCCGCCRVCVKVDVEIPYRKVANIGVKYMDKYWKESSTVVHAVDGDYYYVSNPSSKQDTQSKYLALHRHIFGKQRPEQYRRTNPMLMWPKY